ncbi:hypothetical protein OSL79_20315, partial [Escherichia coli]|nr:hypothetical protein [Escherichia coli]
MNWPQITLIILFAFGLGVTAIRHGEPRNDKYSFWWQLAGNGFAPIFPDTCYHLTHYWPAAADIPV